MTKALWVSLGKANYYIEALIGKRPVKADNFNNSDHKRAYFYSPTSRGVETKAKMSVRLLARKMAEYYASQIEIENLRAAV